MKKLMLVSTLTLINTTVFACDSAEVLKTIQQKEATKLLENAPTFRHAWEDKKIKLRFANAKTTAEGCAAKMTLVLPKEDVEEVTQYLDANPAKRILLAAQGYGAPAETTTVDYFYSQEGTDMNDKNLDLSKLHSNVEFAYQSLAQERVVFDKNATNSVAWDQITLKAETENCNALSAEEEKQSNVNCACRVEKLSKVITPREMELVNFINSQPYSTATGALNSYKEIRNNVDSDCNI